MRRWLFFSAFVGLVLLAAPQNGPSQITREDALWNACIELFEGMPRENAKSVFETHKLGSPNQWAAIGNGEPYESWYWHSLNEPSKRNTKEYSSLRVDTQNNKITDFSCYIYSAGKLEGHRCVRSQGNCEHFDKEVAPKPMPTPPPSRRLQWLK